MQTLRDSSKMTSERSATIRPARCPLGRGLPTRAPYSGDQLIEVWLSSGSGSSQLLPTDMTTCAAQCSWSRASASAVGSTCPNGAHVAPADIPTPYAGRPRVVRPVWSGTQGTTVVEHCTWPEPTREIGETRSMTARRADDILSAVQRPALNR